MSNITDLCTAPQHDIRNVTSERSHPGRIGCWSHVGISTMPTPDVSNSATNGHLFELDKSTVCPDKSTVRHMKPPPPQATKRNVGTCSFRPFASKCVQGNINKRILTMTVPFALNFGNLRTPQSQLSRAPPAQPPSTQPRPNQRRSGQYGEMEMGKWFLKDLAVSVLTAMPSFFSDLVMRPRISCIGWHFYIGRPALKHA
ncbi:hypothetical protein QBC43DRAFT_322737 [Cladorrhinum sp. PSN259]|nr:hypothetical protein QBC43DRAFT_322737 [Cladorrhinum sp. PSN259]